MANELQRKILIADDDEGMRRFCQGTLNEAGYAVEGREADRRLDHRFCWNEDCLMDGGPPKGRPFASTADISRNGIRIRYMGSPIREGLRVGVTFKSLGFKSLATVVWSWALNSSESISGLRLLEPIPAYSIMAVVNTRPFIPPLISTNRQ